MPLEIQRFLGWLVLVLGLIVGLRAQAQENFPALTVPPKAKLVDIGGPVVKVNGQSAKLMEVAAPGTVEDLFAFYRAQFGATAVEPKMGNKPILSGFVQNTYITLMVDEIKPQGVRGHILQTHMPSRPGSVGTENKLLPSGSRMLSQFESSDEGRMSNLRVYANGLSVQSNVDFVEQQLAQRGFTRAPFVADDAGNVASLKSSSSTLVYFKGPQNAQALLRIFEGGGQRIIILNMVNVS
jgi:hypothetical protein